MIEICHSTIEGICDTHNEFEEYLHRLKKYGEVYNYSIMMSSNNYQFNNFEFKIEYIPYATLFNEVE